MTDSITAFAGMTPARLDFTAFSRAGEYRSPMRDEVVEPKCRLVKIS